MNAQDCLSPLSRRLMWVATAAFALMGLALFVAPSWSADHFLWRISDMVARTMGGWYLGSAAMAALVAYHARWRVARAPLAYVGLFALTELLVVAQHLDAITLRAPLALPYILALVIAILATLAVVSDAAHRVAKFEDEGAPVPVLVRLLMALFVVFVLYLAKVALSGSSAGLYGSIFPEPMLLFTLQAFGAFYFSLAASVLAVITARRLTPITVHVQGGIVLIVLITVASLAHHSSFNVAVYPSQWIYLGVYLAALALAAAYLLIAGRPAPRARPC
jgi:hypothetical protein